MSISFVGGDQKSVKFGIAEVCSFQNTPLIQASLHVFLYYLFTYKIILLDQKASEIFLIFCQISKHIFSSSHEVGGIEHRASKTPEHM